MVESEIPGFPLSWPVGWGRTSSFRRKHSRYQAAFVKTREELLRELRLFGAKHIVISTNIPLRRDGLPYANMREPDDPGVAVYWVDRNREPRVMACDSWRTVRDNMRAISITIASLRAIDRANAGEVLSRAFQGFKPLPESAGQAKRGWRTVLGIDGNATAETVRARHRQLTAIHHPDKVGGSEARQVELNVALGEALAEIAGI